MGSLDIGSWKALDVLILKDVCIYCDLIIFWNKIDFSFIADIQQIRIKQFPIEYSVELGYIQYFIWVSSSGDRNFRSSKPLLPTAI